MQDDQRAIAALTEAVGHSISEIQSGIEAYVYQSDDSAYRRVVTELRKLLVDVDAVQSFRKSTSRAKGARNLIELHYGNGRNIRLKSFRPSKVGVASDFVDVTPDTYAFREDILHAATHDATLVSLRTWLDEDLAYDRNGRILKVGTTIKYIAGREGAHIINPVGDARDDASIAFFDKQPSPHELENTDFNQSNPWRQFVIDAGMRLLEAKFTSGERLVEHTIDMPTVRREESTIRLQKRLRK